MATVDSPSSSSRAWKLAATGIYSSSFAALGLTFSVLGPTLLTLAAQTHTSVNDISVLFVARSIGSLVGSVGGGRLFDRFPGHRVVALTMALMIAALVIVPLSTQLWLLTAVLFLNGIAHGTMNVGGNLLLVWVHGRSVAPYMNALHFFFGLGTFVAPIVVAQVVLLTGGISWAYWLLALVSLPVALAPLWVRSPQPEQRAAQIGTGKVDGWLVLWFTLIFFGYAGAGQAFGGWIYSFVTRLNLADETTAAYLNSAFWGALTLGRLLSIPLAVRINPKTMLRADLVGALASLGLVALFPRSLFMIALGAAGLGFCLATIFPTTMSLASRCMALTGRVTSIFSVGSSLGALVFPWLVGQFFESIGPDVMIYFNLVNLALTLGIYILLIRRLGLIDRLDQPTISQGAVPEETPESDA